MSKPLNPLTLPLAGSALIEASAGTGKTWTIAALYLRFVLGHECEARLPADILVMTFTKAATRELSDRIRSRLVEAAACFRGAPVPAHDTFLQGLLDAHAPGAAREHAAWRLSVAAEAMDEAAIHTIDAWCQRMLREHAFDSGCLFDEELQSNEAALRAKAIRDYWRQQVYPLYGDLLALALARWTDVDALTSDVKDLLEKALPAGAGDASLHDCITRTQQARAQAVAHLKTGWPAQAGQMLQWLSDQLQRKDGPFNKRMLPEARVTGWLDTLKAWAQGNVPEPPDLTPTARKRLTRAGLEEALKDGATIAPPAVFDRFEELLQALDALPDIGQAMRLHAAGCVQARLQQLKATSGTFGFADMLDRLDRALDESQRGASAARLRERILRQYPVALIDEFQDTSPVQLSIFDRLHRIADNDPARALLLIGDPKQAIYGFRGADIYSYLTARQATAGRHYALDTNYRSTQALVNAVNALFDGAEQRPGAGAFMFGAPGTAGALPFVKVRAQGRRETLTVGDKTMAALTLVVDEPLRNKEDSRRLFAALCAERIVMLLNDPQAGFEVEDEGVHTLRPLRAADIAVLVRNRTEAEAVREAMRARGLASVYLSDKDTIWQTPEAADLLRLLQAVAASRDVRLVRAALATTLMGYSLPELVALASNDALFDQRCEQFQQLQLTWRTQGVLAMIRRALHGLDLPARWLATDDPTQQGERRLTNVLQLAELLQAASAEAEGEQALVRWLARQIDEAGDGLNSSDEAVLRLESDADLVKVVTVHKSKGLEYPLVFLPFAAHFRDLIGPGESRNDLVLLLPQGGADDGERAGADREAGRRSRALVIAPTHDQMAQAERERQREELRLLYVALTRARHALWVGLSGLQVGNDKRYEWHRSAIGYLLSGAVQQEAGQRITDVRAFAEATAGVDAPMLPADLEPDTVPCTRLLPREAPPALVSAPAYRADFDRQWAISSYSALVRDAAWGAASGAGTGAGTGDNSAPPRQFLDDEAPDPAGPPASGEALPATDRSRTSAQPWHRFPRGALAGNFLHDQLEWLAGERFALDTSDELQRALLRRCERQGWGHRADDVLAWLRAVCTRPLPALGQPLAALATRAPEMEFWFPSDGLRTRRIDALCQQHLDPGEPRPELPERELRGMLMGFADLVFEHGGRYWVLDYKSNTLGTRDADYTQAAMQRAMREHRYDVQAALYLLALHRLLRQRLGAAYQPAQHLGGAIYLFLRGVGGPEAGCCHIAAPLALLDALDAEVTA